MLLNKNACQEKQNVLLSGSGRKARRFKPDAFDTAKKRPVCWPLHLKGIKYVALLPTLSGPTLSCLCRYSLPQVVPVVATGAVINKRSPALIICVRFNIIFLVTSSWRLWHVADDKIPSGLKSDGYCVSIAGLAETSVCKCAAQPVYQNNACVVVLVVIYVFSLRSGIISVIFLTLV